MHVRGYTRPREAVRREAIVEPSMQSKTKGAEQEQAANHHKWRPWLGQPI